MEWPSNGSQAPLGATAQDGFAPQHQHESLAMTNQKQKAVWVKQLSLDVQTRRVRKDES